MSRRGARGSKAAGEARRASATRRRLLLAGLLGSALLVAVRSFQLTVLEGERWRTRALEQQADSMVLPSPRGTIFDRDGVPLAGSLERYSIAIAGREVVDTPAVVARLREHAGMSAHAARGAIAEEDGWAVLRGRYDETVRDALDDMRGIHFERVTKRFYPHATLAGELLGMVNASGEALGGIELEFDSLLTGRPGRAIVRRDHRGQALPGQMLRATEPVPGRDVVLTIDVELQEIADDALRQALENTEAASGDLVLVDPRTGEVLAAVSRRRGRPSRNWGGVTVPYEPGSTLKPFTVAMLLAEGRAELSDSLFGENGSYTIHGRTITDVHAFGWITLEDALRESSNVGIAKAAAVLEADVRYDYLRRFGFGSPTGVKYPSESGGRLRRPAQWSKQSAASLSIGYEISVTPLQMAMAYAALANGGLLLEPRLVRAVRTRDGRVERTFEPRVVRRVVPERVTDQLRDVLADVVEEGTGQRASMGAFRVAGKTGTARIAVGGRYVPGAYTATFAGFFPADEPQLVFVVKLDRPRGAYYGGLTAAPVTRATLEAALAARSTPIDKAAVATAPPADRPAPAIARSNARLTLVGAPSAEAPPLRRPVVLPVHAHPETEEGRTAPRAVPDVAGLPLRDAAALLYAAGFHVRVEGTGAAKATVPEAGAKASAGHVVRLIAEQSRQ
ncbi:MAG: penicillin-binding transpeptidase domain-containing protein [Longimicrobiales bacterium]